MLKLKLFRLAMTLPNESCVLLNYVWTSVACTIVG